MECFYSIFPPFYFQSIQFSSFYTSNLSPLELLHASSQPFWKSHPSATVWCSKASSSQASNVQETSRASGRLQRPKEKLSRSAVGLSGGPSVSGLGFGFVRLRLRALAADGRRGGAGHGLRLVLLFYEVPFWLLFTFSVSPYIYFLHFISSLRELNMRRFIPLFHYCIILDRFIYYFVIPFSFHLPFLLGPPSLTKGNDLQRPEATFAELRNDRFPFRRGHSEV